MLLPAVWPYVHQGLETAAPYARTTLAAVDKVVRYLAHHTGVPAVVVAACIAVLMLRIVRRFWPVVLEVAIALVLILAATRWGWVRW